MSKQIVSLQSLNGQLEQRVLDNDLRGYKHGDIVDCELYHNYAPSKSRVYKKARVVISGVETSNETTQYHG